MERNVLLDRCKGYACFLVLFGHVIMGMRNSGVGTDFLKCMEEFIWSFHVPLFLFLSGAVYRLTGGWESKKTRTGFIGHKFINLGVPYLVFSAVYILINSFVGDVNTKSYVGDILYIWKTPVAQYWFLYALFFLFVIWTVLSVVLKNYQITVLVVLLAYIVPLFGIGFGCFEAVMYSALAFGMGTFIDIKKITFIPVWSKLIVILTHLILGVMAVKSGTIGYPFIGEFLEILGIYSGILLISIIMRLPLFAHILDFLNKYSFQTYLLHTIFTAGVRVMLLKLNVVNPYIHILFGVFAGIFFSYVASVIAKKTVVGNIFFFPVSTYKKLKQR